MTALDEHLKTEASRAAVEQIRAAIVAVGEAGK
jgi:quinol monooxygenase YgiN